MKATEDGQTAEMAVVGAEGIIGAAVFFGLHHAPCDVIVQMAGPGAHILPVHLFRDEMERHGALYNRVVRYSQALMSQIMQSTVCNGLHSARERCARWLLGRHDRAAQDEFPFTHDFLATMLGLRRPTVTIVAGQLQAAGLSAPGKLLKLWDYTAGLGGPIKKDRLWYFLNLRNQGSHTSVPSMFANVNAGDPSKWTYVADRNRQSVTAGNWSIASLRLTVQASPRNKFNVYWDEQKPCTGSTYSRRRGCVTAERERLYARRSRRSLKRQLLKQVPARAADHLVVTLRTAC